MARSWSRRWLGIFPTLTKRSWEEVAQGLEDLLRRTWDSVTDGLPAGYAKDVIPSDLEAGGEGSPGAESCGWASACHSHGVPVDMPVKVGVRLEEAEGESEAFPRADHRHEVETIRSVGFTVDGGVNVVTTGFKGWVPVPFRGTCIGWTLEADQVGSCTVDVWKADRRPGATDSICGTKPALAGAVTASGGVGDWTNLEMEVGDIFGFMVEAATTVTLLTLVVEVKES